MTPALAKAAWAARKATALRTEADAARARHVPGADWRGVQRKARTVANLDREALRYERMAARYQGERA
jgi:hypothetical protein